MKALLKMYAARALLGIGITLLVAGGLVLLALMAMTPFQAAAWAWNSALVPLAQAPPITAFQAFAALVLAIAARVLLAIAVPR